MKLIELALTRYRTEGMYGLSRAIFRRLFSLRPTVHPLTVALEAVLRHDGFCIVQLGANVGDTPSDPLFETLSTRLVEGRGTLIVVEPVEHLFHQLVENYRGVPNVIFENVAVAAESGPAIFYRLGVDPTEHGYPAWLSGLGSLKKERMESLWDRYENFPDYQRFYLEHRIEEAVTCITFVELLARHGVRVVDLLQMDVEGVELEILKSIDFARTPIRFINYERVLLQERKKEADHFMKARGYQLVDYGQDTFCYRAQDAHLATRWSR